jgi:hypothetical protein
MLVESEKPWPPARLHSFSIAEAGGFANFPTLGWK